MITGTRNTAATFNFANLILQRMKKIVLFGLLIAAAFVVNGQTTKTVTKPAVKLATTPPNILKNGTDSLSYILGEIAAFNLIQQGLGEVKLNNTIFLRAVNDIMAKKKPLLEDGVANAMLGKYMEKKQAEKSKTVIEAGEKFLAQNKLKPGVKTTASGLQYEVIQEGTGIKPAAVDTFVAHYRGTLLDGTEFDASYNRNQPLTLGVSQVIRGWTEGLQLMAVGSKYKFYIPYNLAYGAMGQGQIPGGAMLIFEVDLLDVKKKQ
jgi:FKBP-type peptidyl-prolyl cis-trans isomerase FklB